MLFSQLNFLLITFQVKQIEVAFHGLLKAVPDCGRIWIEVYQLNVFIASLFGILIGNSFLEGFKST